MSSSRFAPVQVIAWTLSWRIIRARLRPIPAVLIAPESVTIIFPPASRWSTYPCAAATVSRLLKFV